jgi:outer membrane lipoprotein-sorting protein
MILTKKFRFIFVLIFVTIALLASGCTEKNLSVEEITAKMLDKQNSIKDYSYTMRATSYFERKTKESESHVMIKKPNMIKEIIAESGKENKTISISDGKIAWSYNPDTNTVLKIKLSNTSELTKNDYINIVSEFLNNTNVKLLGVERIDGKTTCLIETTPKEKDRDYEFIYRTKIWVDQETWMPLQYEIYNIAGNLTMKIKILDLKVNSGISDSEFKFEVPTGAKIVEMRGS